MNNAAQRQIRPGLVLAAMALATLPTAPVDAHHSFAMFDNDRSITVEGIVKEFQWTNPHVWVQLVARDETGKDVEWSIEGGSPNGLARQGWKRTSINPGDKAQVEMHPLKNGSAGGSLISVTINGAKVGR